MKLLILILFPFLSFAQQSTYTWDYAWDTTTLYRQLRDYYPDSIIQNGGVNGKWLIRFRKVTNKDSVADVSWEGIYDTITKVNKYKEFIPQQSTYKPGDSAWIVSSDTSKVKVYTGGTWVRSSGIDLAAEQAWMDTLAARWSVTVESRFNPYDTLPKEIGAWSYRAKDSNIISLYDVLKLDSVQRCTILSADSRIKSYLPEKNKTTIEYKSGEIWVFTNDGSKLPVKRPHWHRYRAWNVDDTTHPEINYVTFDSVQYFGEDTAPVYHYKSYPFDDTVHHKYELSKNSGYDVEYTEVYYGHPTKEGSEHWFIRNGKTGKWVDVGKNGKVIYKRKKKTTVQNTLCGSNEWKKMAEKYSVVTAETGMSGKHLVMAKLVDNPKYDTIGPVWKLISHTGPGYNPAMAAQVYEVRIYKNEWVTVDPNRHSADGYSTTLLGKWPEEKSIPHHFGWLGVDKKPLQYKVWEDKIITP